MTIPSPYDLVTPIVEGIIEGLLDILDEARCEREDCSGACQAVAPDRVYSGCARGSGAPAASPSGCVCRVTLLELLDGIRNMKSAMDEAAPSRCCSDQKESSSSRVVGTGSAAVSPRLVVECLNAFGRRGNLEAMASVDLVGELTTVPGVAGKGWTYADITPVRLAKLLAPYDIHPRNMDLSDGRRRKAYSRRALVRALYSQPL